MNDLFDKQTAPTGDELARMLAALANPHRLRIVATLSSEWRYSHWCFSDRHHASIIEFENLSSVNASKRRSTPVSINASTAAFTFSTPASANTTGVVVERIVRLASSSTATLFAGANVSATRQARTRRENCRSPHGDKGVYR